MSESILERIAQWHLAAVAAVTVANGYQQTLVPVRTNEAFLSGEAITDLSVLCSLGDGAAEKVRETLDVAGPAITWSIQSGGGSALCRARR